MSPGSRAYSSPDIVHRRLSDQTASGVVSAFVQIRGCVKNFPTFLHSGGFCVKKRLAIRKFPAFFALRFSAVCKHLSNSSIFKQALKKHRELHASGVLYVTPPKEPSFSDGCAHGGVLFPRDRFEKLQAHERPRRPPPLHAAKRARSIPVYSPFSASRIAKFPSKRSMIYCIGFTSSLTQSF